MTTKPDKVIKTYNLDLEIAKKCDDLAPFYGFKSSSALVEHVLKTWINTDQDDPRGGHPKTPALVYSQVFERKEAS